MGPDFIDNHPVELSATARDVGTAWLLAAIVVIVLMTVVAPFFSA